MKKIIKWKRNILIINEIDSTNKYIKEHINDIVFVNYCSDSEWIILQSYIQKKGIAVKGKWDSEEEDLIFSILFKPKKLFVSKKYIINVITSNAIHKVLSKIIIKKSIWIKWPNDIVVDNKKISGILTESCIFSKKIKYIIIGVGLNIKKKKIKKYSSSSLEEYSNINRDNLLIKIVKSIQREYFFFITYGENFVRNYYEKFLYRKNCISTFFLISKNIYKTGIIKGISSNGNLLIYFNNRKYFFQEKDIKIIYI